MHFINRSVITIRRKKKFLEWINESDPAKKVLTLKQVNEEPNVYLIPDFEDYEDLERYLYANYLAIFEHELEGWYVVEYVWPEDRNYQVFLSSATWSGVRWCCV